MELDEQKMVVGAERAGKVVMAMYLGQKKGDMGREATRASVEGYRQVDDPDFTADEIGLDYATPIAVKASAETDQDHMVIEGARAAITAYETWEADHAASAV
jgi:hypothetical protein